jgi:hypothetical protein
MNKYYVYIGLFVAFFVVFLGMRNPWLDQKPGPKHKARAVITQTASKNLSLSLPRSGDGQDHTTPLATLLATIYEWNAPAVATLAVPEDQSSTYPLHSSIRSSRAPPALIS